MRTRGAVVFIAFAAALAVSGGALASTSLPGSGYRWAQPGTAPLTTPGAQPPASIPIAAPLHVAAGVVFGSGYEWAQPGTAAVTQSGQPPALVPIG